MSDERPSESGEPADDFYRRLLDGSPIPLVATDEQFRVVYRNAPAAELLKLALGDPLGKSLYELVPEARHKFLKKLLRRTVQRRETTQLEVHIQIDKTGESDLVFMLAPIADDTGAICGVAGWILDETHRRRLAERLAQAEKLASLGTLAGGVAHHFNNILGGVATFVDFALTSGDETAMKRALQMTAEAAARATRITQSLLSFAKEETHRTDLADLTEVVLTFAHLVERPLSERKIKLQLNLHPIPSVPIEAQRMHQTLGNLLTNAEDAMPEGGTLHLSIDRAGSDAVLTFADTGCGIKSQDLPQVFEPFFTTKGLLAGGERGNPGLGLSVVHGIIVDMGGRIDVESTVGEGTRFLIRFPIPAESTSDN